MEDTATKTLQVEGSFIGLRPFNVQYVVRMRETAQRTRENVHFVSKGLPGLLTLCTSNTNTYQESVN